jgi:hypothetical protein
MSKLYDFLQDPFRLGVFLIRRLSPLIKDDETYLHWYYYLNMHKSLNLKTPLTYNEKLNWLKLYDRNPYYTTLVDKLKVKDVVAQKIGDEHVIKTLGIWKLAEDIEWDKLPDRFVLKTTHGGGNIGVMICRDKSTFDRTKAVANMNAALKQNLYYYSREWPYKDVEPMIFAEEYMEDEHGELRDYKFFCFDGKCRMVEVLTERQTRKDAYADFFDKDYSPLPFRGMHQRNSITPEKPQGFDEMVSIAEQLSVGFPHVRIDLYVIKGRVYFGEYTFYHNGGVTRFKPSEWDEKIGSWLKLPNNT